MEQHEHLAHHRLTTDTKPRAYVLALEPDLDGFVYSGNVRIDVALPAATTDITLHAVDLTLHASWVIWNGKRYVATNIVKPEMDVVTLSVSESIGPGSATIEIDFTGMLNDRMHGFYRSEYALPNGETRIMAATQFEATDARRCFPCFDEPAFPATFAVSLTIPENREALSNMPVASTEPLPTGKKRVQFAATPVMSTYLLAFAVGEFERVSHTTNGKVDVNVITTPGKRTQGLFALDVAVKTLDYFSEYYGIPYPLPKCDLLAMPDFAAGAMENWGLVTFRETALLIDEAQSAESARQRIATVVAHELAHQWFGNLVTMDWWTHLWLNEGFATFVEYLAVHHLFPEWDIWTQFAGDTYANALTDDAYRNTHPIEVEVRHPNEISEIFDAVSYSKGASVIRMIEVYLTPEVFRKGLTLYLTRHAYGNASTDDLWTALEEISGKPVKAIMDTWTRQPGYPVLDLTRIEDDRYRVTQSRFIASPGPLLQEEQNQQWRIPVPLDAENTTAAYMESRSLDLSLPHEREWVKLNARQVGFFRVNYTTELWDLLKRGIEKGELGIIDRFGVINDLYALAAAGKQSTTQLLEMLAAFKKETHYVPLVSVLGVLRALWQMVAGSATEQDISAFGRSILGDAVGRSGWGSGLRESHLAIMQRSALLCAYGRYGDTATIAEAQRRFGMHVRKEQSLDPNLRHAVYQIAAANGAEEIYESIMALFHATDLQEEKVRCLRALGNFRDPDLLQRTLALSLSNDVRSQDTMFILAGVAENPHGRNLAWTFLKEQWPEFNRRYGEGGLKTMGHIIASVTANFYHTDAAMEVEKFFADHPAPSARRTILQALEQIRSNVAWLARDEAETAKWLAAHRMQ